MLKTTMHPRTTVTTTAIKTVNTFCAFAGNSSYNISIATCEKVSNAYLAPKKITHMISASCTSSCHEKGFEKTYRKITPAKVTAISDHRNPDINLSEFLYPFHFHHNLLLLTDNILNGIYKAIRPSIFFFCLIIK